MLGELFWLLFSGSMVAWLFVVILITFICYMVATVWFYHKMPRISKLILWNELRQHNPLILNCYDDQFAEFQNPILLSEGLFWQRSGRHLGWHFHPKVPDELVAKEEKETEATKTANGASAKKKISEALQALYRKAFHIAGSSSRFYVAYSGKGEIVNPEILALLDNNELFKRSQNGDTVHVKKDALQMALESIKEDYIQIQPLFLTTFLDGRELKEWLSKSFGDTQLATLEERVRQDERRPNMGKGGGNMKMAILVCIIGVAALVGMYFLAKYMGYF